MIDTLRMATDRLPTNEPIVLGTKAETLARLRPLVKHSVIGAQVCFDAVAWPKQRQRVLRSVRNCCGASPIAVRSSSRLEDTRSGTNAGRFLSVIDVDGGDEGALCAAIESVIESFSDRSPNDQVLVQAMVRDVALAGVAFTRSPNGGAPYYFINYDDQSGRTDTVTQGSAMQPKLCVLHRSLAPVPAEAHPFIHGVVRSLRELESLIGEDALDVEFAVDKTGAVHVLQVRGMGHVRQAPRSLQKQVGATLAAAQKDFCKRQERCSGLFGRRTIFGAMPDWNPAEMIGMTPRRLALSLYRYLITDEICAAERAAMGYHDIRPNPLLVEICGHPYMDLRASFSSFIPAAVSEGLAERLVNYYLTKLEAVPELHDKVEFEVALTALDFDFLERRQTLRQAGFGARDLDLLRHGLLQVTRFAMTQVGAQPSRLGELEARYEQLTSAQAPSLQRALQLLLDCRIWGTPAFAQLARMAFVAAGFLRSAVARNMIRTEEMQNFLRSLNSGAQQLSRDAARVRHGEIAWHQFVTTYGHLRPGTYDLSVPSYGEAPEVYLQPMVQSAEMSAAADFHFSQSARSAFQAALRELELPDDSDAFIAFLRGAIEGRETAKFIFTRNLSRALSDIAVVGAENGLSAAQTAQLDFIDLAQCSARNSAEDVCRWLTAHAVAGERRHRLAQAIELPPLLSRDDQLLSFVYAPTVPNFVGQQQVAAPTVEVGAHFTAVPAVAGKIALLTHGDPGFDWLFAMGIVGLVTLYGGVNSHMAIRAGELGIPAALGVGAAIFTQCRAARMLRIDGETRQIEAVG